MYVRMAVVLVATHLVVDFRVEREVVLVELEEAGLVFCRRGGFLKDFCLLFPGMFLNMRWNLDVLQNSVLSLAVQDLSKGMQHLKAAR